MKNRDYFNSMGRQCGAEVAVCLREISKFVRGRAHNRSTTACLSAHIALVVPLQACLLAVLLSERLSSRLRVSSFFLAHLG
jgi:hypothetical protein